MTSQNSDSIAKNQMVVTFDDDATAEFVRLMFRRTGTNIADYIVDNLEWDDQLECLSSWNNSDKITFETCEGCPQIDRCPDAVKEKKQARGRS